MEHHQVTVTVPVVKKYSVLRHKFRDSIYRGDCRDIAMWYYSAMDSSPDNVIIHTYGDIHQTYPNRPHLSVSYEVDGHISPRYHMSIDPNGYYYAQPLFASKKKKRRTRKSKRIKPTSTRT